MWMHSLKEPEKNDSLLVREKIANPFRNQAYGGKENLIVYQKTELTKQSN